MANYMAEVAKLLGVELGEEFEIQYPSPCAVKTTAVFSEDGFNIVHTDSVILQPYWKDAELHGLLKGTLTIKRKPWKPKYGDYYWAVSANPIDSFCYLKWEGAISDYSNYKLGNCYKTMSEAKENKSKWVSFYESDEVLKV